MLSSYPAIFYKEKNGTYSVSFPDLNYLATQGNDFNDAYAMAIDCLAGYLHSLKYDDNAAYPVPSNIKDIDPIAYAEELDYDDYQDYIVNMVAVDVEEYAKTHFNRSIRKSITIPEWLNDLATQKGINFSKTLQEALKTKLGLNK